MLKYEDVSVLNWNKIKKMIKSELDVDFKDNFKGHVHYKRIKIRYDYDEKNCSLKIGLPWYVPKGIVDKAIKDELGKIKGA